MPTQLSLRRCCCLADDERRRPHPTMQIHPMPSHFYSEDSAVALTMKVPSDVECQSPSCANFCSSDAGPSSTPTINSEKTFIMEAAYLNLTLKETIKCCVTT
uniref:Uncharacterized protein n=1 Tax=Panagrellus redivivus TaxID=6233 RepID=A0A7E4VF26_PANRE